MNILLIPLALQAATICCHENPGYSTEMLPETLLAYRYPDGPVSGVTTGFQLQRRRNDDFIERGQKATGG